MKLERWGWYSIAVNVILAAINLVVAVASGSLAVQAEMVPGGMGSGPEMRTVENVALAAQMRDGSSFRFFRRAAGDIPLICLSCCPANWRVK